MKLQTEINMAQASALCRVKAWSFYKNGGFLRFFGAEMTPESRFFASIGYQADTRMLSDETLDDLLPRVLAIVTEVDFADAVAVLGTVIVRLFDEQDSDPAHRAVVFEKFIAVLRSHAVLSGLNS